RLDLGLVGESRGAGAAEALEDGAAEAVGGKEAVEIAPGDEAVGALRALRPRRRAVAEPEQRAGGRCPGRRADLHLVAAHRLAGGEIDAAYLAQGLGVTEHGFDLDEAEPRRLAGGAFDTLGVGDAAPEHLVAGAEPKDAAAAADMRQDIDVPAGRSQRREIGERRLRAGQDDEIPDGGHRPSPLDELARHLGLGGPRDAILLTAAARQR